MSDPAHSPKAFISYSWTSEPHKKWVLDLATRMKEDGVLVVLDRWHLKPGHDAHAFMEQMVTDPSVTHVILVCDEAYAAKADRRKGGVGTEAQILTPELYNKTTQEKFIPVARTRDDDGVHVPAYLKSRLFIDFTSDDRFEEAYTSLLRMLHDAPELREPPLGKPPPHIFSHPGQVVVTAGKFRRLRDAVDKGNPKAEVMLRDYLEQLSEALAALRPTAGLPEHTFPDEVVVGVIEKSRPYRDEFADFVGLYADHLDTENAYANVHDFLERLLDLKTPPHETRSYSDWQHDAFYFIAYEWFLYLIAGLIRGKKYTLAARFADDTYHIRRQIYGDLAAVSFEVFNSYARTLEQNRKSRLDLNFISVMAHLIHESANHPRIRFRDLAQADVVLMVRPFLKDPKTSVSWYARLTTYIDQLGTLDVFATATSSKGLPAVQGLLGAASAADLSSRIVAALSNTGLSQFVSSKMLEFRGQFPRLLNWDELQRFQPSRPGQ